MLWRVLTQGATAALGGSSAGVDSTAGRLFLKADDGIRGYKVTGVQTCALPIWNGAWASSATASTRCASGRLASAAASLASTKKRATAAATAPAGAPAS